MAGAPTALTATDAARAVADAAYPNGFVPNVVLANGLPGHRPAAEFFRAQGRAQGRAHGRAQGQRSATRAALEDRTARRHARPKRRAAGRRPQIRALAHAAASRQPR